MIVKKMEFQDRKVAFSCHICKAKNQMNNSTDNLEVRVYRSIRIFQFDIANNITHITRCYNLQ